MIIRIMNADEPVMDYTVTNIDAWYDRHSRSWVIQKLNKDGYQVGDADYTGTREDKDWIVANLKEEYGLN